MAWINPNIPEGYDFIKDTLKFYVYQHGDILSRATDNFYYDYTSGANKADVIGDIRNYSFSSGLNASLSSVHSENNYTTFGHILSWFPIMTIRVNTTTNPITVSYSNDSEKTAFTTYPYFNWWYQINNAEKIIITNDTNWEEKKATEFRTLLSALQYIHQWYANVNIYVDDELWIKAGLDPTYTSNGGGATHIAKVTGQLKDLSSNLSDILMISGGGGGGLLVGETEYTGKEAGGISGSGDNSADQTTGNAFGLGESGTNVSGGGSGLYGGYKGTSAKSGGAGSGYIGNSLLSNKKMVGYNVPTSSAEGTKTESVNEASESPVSGKPKSGNGFARIKFLRDLDISNMTEWTPDGAFGWQVTYDSETKENHITGQCNQFWEYYEFPLDVERNKNYTVSLQFKGTNYNYFALYDTLRILDRWLNATQIQQEDGINYSYVIAESDTHFSNQSNYVDCSVTFNSGNRDKVWLYIGAGYVYTNTWMDLYFKNITVVKNN